ncbi:MAG: three component ABC system middle component [Bacteroidota bacterium]
MTPWDDRPPEVAYLFNPAFCALLLRHAIKDYARERGEGMPLGLAALVLPVVLHGRTRRALPASTITHLHAWLEDNPEVQIGLAQRVESIAPHTREAILFALQRQVLTVTDGLLTAPTVRLRAYAPDLGSEAEACVRRAGFLGRWLARSGSPATILALWGLRV